MSELVAEGLEGGGEDGASSLPAKETGHGEGAQASLGPACGEQGVCLERHNALGFAHFHLADEG